MKLNKKAEGSNWTMTEVLSLIIGIVILLILGYGASKLFSPSISQEEKNAQNLADILKSKIDAYEIGQTNKFLLQGFDQADGEQWIITGWSYGEAGRPDKCSLESCVCICPQNAPNDRSHISSSCQEKGFCRLFGNSAVSVKRTYDCKLVGGDSDYIFVPTSVSEINLKKEKDSIKLIYSDPSKPCSADDPFTSI